MVLASGCYPSGAILQRVVQHSSRAPQVAIGASRHRSEWGSNSISRSGSGMDLHNDICVGCIVFLALACCRLLVRLRYGTDGGQPMSRTRDQVPRALVRNREQSQVCLGNRNALVRISPRPRTRKRCGGSDQNEYAIKCSYGTRNCEVHRGGTMRRNRDPRIEKRGAPPWPASVPRPPPPPPAITDQEGTANQAAPPTPPEPTTPPATETSLGSEAGAE